MFRFLASAVLILGSWWLASPTSAQETIECHSRNYQYGECYAGRLRQPQLIHQISSSSCILNRSWGYNPRSRYIWVAQGCSGVFADVAGYHHGRGDGFDPNARVYNDRGNDVGAVVGGVVLGAILGGVVSSDHDKHRHSASNVRDDGGYNGCHGIGCLVDNPDDDQGDQRVDSTPQFDKDGFPNFDEQGNYQGCHGIGCLVDNPDDDQGD